MRRCVPIAVALGVALASAQPAGAAFPGANGMIAFESDRDGHPIGIYVMSADGSGTRRLADGINPALSADGSKIAFRSRGGIFVMNVDGTGKTRIVSSGDQPAFFADGRRIAYADGDIFVASVDGTTPPQRVTTDPALEEHPAVSPDGSTIAFHSGRLNSPDIWAVNADGTNERRLTEFEDDSEMFPNFSPDGEKIVFALGSGPGWAVSVVNADGSGETRLGRLDPNLLEPAFSPDGTKIVYDGTGTGGFRSIFVMDATGGAGTPISSGPGEDGRPDWGPLPPPIVFVHGFAGSKIACGGDDLFPDVPVEFPDMRLEADGETNRQDGTCNPAAGPTEILRSFLGTQVYGPALDYLDRIAPGNNYAYVWDWRRSPQRAVGGLDLLVERARCGGSLPPGAASCQNPVHEQVVLMGHSMGGLVIRDYIGDPARADKVRRALTIGTPYWGSPKAIFPLRLGQESPASSSLDAIIIDGQFQDWARNAQGLYFLYPSANYGGWLTVDGRQPRPLDRAGLLDYVSALGGTRALAERALDAHAQDLDGFRTNGVDYQAFVGSGLATFKRVTFFEAGGQDFVRVTYGHGDETVPVESAVQGPAGTGDPLGEDIPIHYACGVSHVPLPGDPAVTDRITEFLLSGAEIVSGPTSCSSSGFQIAIFPVDPPVQPAAAGGPVKTRSALSAPEPTIQAAAASSEPMSLEDAEAAGLIQLVDTGHQKLVVTDSRTPVELTYSAERFELNATAITDAELGETAYYGPLSGQVTLSAGETLTVANAGGPVAPRPDGAPELSIADAGAREGSDANVTVTLSRPAGFPITVEYRTEDERAVADSDYTAREGTLVIEPGAQTATIAVPTTADDELEGSETFTVRLADPFDASLRDDRATVTIRDTDCTPDLLPDLIPCVLDLLPKHAGAGHRVDGRSG